MVDYQEMIERLQATWKPASKMVVIIPGLELEFGTASALDMLNIGAAPDDRSQMIESLRMAKVEPKMSWAEAEQLLSLIPGSEFSRLFAEITEAMDTNGEMTIQQKEGFLEKTPTSDQLSILDSQSTNGLPNHSEEQEKTSSGLRRRSR